MAIQCIFYIEGRPQPCQVLAVADSAPLPARTCERLRQTFCGSGAFINCPVFARVERGLIGIRRRLQATQETLRDHGRRCERAARVA